MNRTRRLIVGLSGASGQVLGIRFLQILAEIPEIESHLVITTGAHRTISLETGLNPFDVKELADVVYDPDDMGAAIASGSFAVAGMVVVPCSMKTLSAISRSYAPNLLTRAADVQLKEGRQVVLVVRETPFHLGHLHCMIRAHENGCVILPPVPTFHPPPDVLRNVVNGAVHSILARLKLGGKPETLGTIPTGGLEPHGEDGTKADR